MQRELAAIYDELKGRLRAGERTVYLSDETLGYLRTAAGRAGPAKPGKAAAGPEKAPVSRGMDGSAFAAAMGQPTAKGASGKGAKKAVPGAVVKAGEEEAEKALPPAAPEVGLSGESRAADWQSVKAQVEADGWCRSQVKPGKQVVFGTGSLEAEIFFCGEAPGADEEVEGIPFVGKAGQLLTKIIGAMGLEREQVYIGNIMNYRPPMPGAVGNRPPTAAEMAYCLPYLRAQLGIVRPKVIVALGKTAVDGLLGADSKRRMTKIRGQWQEFEGTALMPTFHPSYLLRSNNLATKRQVWEDMMLVMERVGLPISDKQRGFFR